MPEWLQGSKLCLVFCPHVPYRRLMMTVMRIIYYADDDVVMVKMMMTIIILHLYLHTIQYNTMLLSVMFRVVMVVVSQPS